MAKQLIPYFSICDGQLAESPAVLSAMEAGFGGVTGEGGPEESAGLFSEGGADALIIFDRSSDDLSHDKDVAALAAVCQAAQIPVYAAGHMNRLEDVKKALYAGCAGVILNGAADRTASLMKEAAARFGKDRVYVSFASTDDLKALEESLNDSASAAVLMGVPAEDASELTELPLISLLPFETVDGVEDALSKSGVEAVSGGVINGNDTDLHAIKDTLYDRGVAMTIPASRIAWEEFKLNSDGLIPVISQDYLTDEVLILAYMNEEAFNKTLKTGKMTYYSRSRQCIWTKGETSGHYQYVRSLTLDCDNDTILAKVIQIGPACHTGRKSCFFQELYEKAGTRKNARRVLDDVYKIIEDRKEHPKEGSYTNYLFDKGVDKILKKVGEENTEIIIAAKNPDASEIKYEISDYLYHLMVLMVEKGVTWDEIADELARR